VSVPPLRERREDIPALVAQFLAEALQRTPSSPVRAISAEALRVLSESPWPGNVRELASCVERGVVFGMEEVLGPEHFAPDAASAVEWSPSWPSSHDGPWTLRRMNRAYTEFVLRETGGDKDRAAKILGINPSTLYRWKQASKG
jgi:two-component system response regulator HydG